VGTDNVIRDFGRSTPHTDNPYPEHTQQPAGTKNIFWLDAPGYPNDPTIVAFNYDANFTSKICPTSGACTCVNWQILLIGTRDSSGNPTADFTDSKASFTKSYRCARALEVTYDAGTPWAFHNHLRALLLVHRLCIRGRGSRVGRSARSASRFAGDLP